MSYHVQRPRPLGAAPGFGPSPGFTPTTAFAQAVDPYSFRFSPPGAVFSPYGWGPDMMIGMPANYTHHLDYVREPIPGARRNIGTMYDVIPPYATGVRLDGLPRSVTEYRTRYPNAIGPPDMVPIHTSQGYRYVKLTPQTLAIRRAQERRGLSGSWSGGGPGYAAEGSGAQLGGMLAVL